jgi:hypothetical protein
MKIFCSASTDAYITDKIIDGRLRAEDANVGRAGTLDLFKLYDENKLNGEEKQNEVSRILIKFDLSKLRKLMTKKLDVSNPNFSAKIKLFDVRSGHATPSNFSVVAHPLNKPFDEGIGRDISSFQDLSVVNFLTASIVNGNASTWHVSGANREGFLGSPADILGSGSFDGGLGTTYLLQGSQKFITGDEDLSIDVTKAISGTLANAMNDYGFRIAFSGSDDTDKKSRFVKRFASRHSSNPALHPRLEVSFPDYTIDDRHNFYFDTNSTIFLKNSRKSSLANVKAGGTEVEGTNSLRLKLVKGSYSKIVLASNHIEGSDGTNQVGVYSASFSIPSEETTEYTKGDTIAKLISREKQVTFDEYWYSLDGTKGFYTGSLTIKADDAESTFLNDEIDIFATNCATTYAPEDQERIRLFGVNHTREEAKPRKKSIKKKSEIYSKLYYRILDANNMNVIFDFDELGESTRISTDTNGMYFDFYFEILPRGRSYLFEYLLVHDDIRKVIRDKSTRFTVR